MFICDLHIHPTLMAFGSGPDGANPHIFLQTTITRKRTSNLLGCLAAVAPGQMKDLSSLSPTSQTDFSNLSRGKCKLVGIALGSMEAGFTQLNIAAIHKLLGSLVGNPGKARIVESISGIHYNKVVYIRDRLSNHQDNPGYFTEFQKEVAYVWGHKDKTFLLDQEDFPYTIRFPASLSELRSQLEEDNNVVAFFGVEGMQSLGIGLSEPTPETDFADRIAFAKSFGGIFLYASLNHHFPNTLAGHARTMGKKLGQLVQQKTDETRGISPYGYKVIDALLNKNIGGKTVLIDLKHFNLKSRRDFYAYFKQNYSGLNLPIICSHTGMTNKSWESVIQTPDYVDTDEMNAHSYFHEWSVNMYKEDVWEIIQSGGLIGIQLDEKRLGGEIIWKRVVHEPGVSKEAAFADLVLANILSVVQTAYEYAHHLGLPMFETLEKAWSCICIGSDFDGLVNPIDNVVTSADFFGYPNLLASRFTPSLSYTEAVHGWDLPFSQIQILCNGKSPAFRLQQVLKENLPAFLNRVLPVLGY